LSPKIQGFLNKAEPFRVKRPLRILAKANFNECVAKSDMFFRIDLLNLVLKFILKNFWKKLLLIKDRTPNRHR
jgi:hypothetical protein